MEHKRFIKLDPDHAARFSELTKREIQVFVYLVQCRNERSGRCNPSRSAIAAATGIGRSHVTETIPALEAKNWIVEADDGTFQIVGPAMIPGLEKVPDSGTTKVPDSGTTKVPDSGTTDENNVPDLGTKVPDLGTKVPDSGTTDENNVPDLGTKVPDLGTKVPDLGTLLIKETTEQTKNRLRTLKAPEMASETAAEPAPKNKPKLTRIPDPFLLTAEMKTWAAANVPDLESLADAHDRFIEYWTDNATKKAFKSNWLLTWRNGMKLARTWERERRADRNRGAQVGKAKTEPATIAAVVPFVAAARRPPDPCPPDQRDQFDAAFKAIAEAVGRIPFDTWFGKVIFDGIAPGGRFKLRADEITIDWITRYYSEILAAAIAAAGARGFVWEYETDQELKHAVGS